MIGLVYPGVNRLDYDFGFEGGIFPAHIESCNRAKVARWLEKVLHLIPIEPRPEGYNPLGKKNLEPEWVARLGRSGRDCYDAIIKVDAKALGASLNLNMKCWEMLLPHVVRHPLIRVDLMALLEAYQTAISGRDVFRLWRRLSDCGCQRAGARRVQGKCARRSTMSFQKQIIVSGGFDDLKSRDLRFLEEAARLGELTALLWPDATLQKLTGKAPKFPFAERSYFLKAVRYVGRVVEAADSAGFDTVPENFKTCVWVDVETTANPAREQFARENQINYRVFKPDELKGFPEPPPVPSAPGRKKVLVTGSYDWFHSGHVRFLEEVSGYGDLYVVVGHDANIRLLKGEGHPLLSQAERRYVVGSIKFVKQALISSGEGWLDAEPEIQRLQPDIYAVNEDGDKGGKREYCRKLGIEYLVLKRTPAPGLPQRSSTDLRGF